MTRWSLFLQTLSLLHHFLGLYSLRDEIAAESDVFAREYVAFRTKVEADIKKIRSSRLSQPQAHAERTKQAEAGVE